ncbi:alpha/beta fold hydrolase [Oceanobacillus sp. CFH 90083]|uniref:alpha/beta fold hydrolase n=1 Tax=Oceanobacillus sp. CFH 90083 TaxID=2592336 RepID=UPI001D153F9E|nr:alpha/beta hydrolase [Oceanobacillus sp. CFH 90083]
MQTENHWLDVSDETSIYIKQWLPDTKAIGILQIAHGMVEHIERYQDFASYCTSLGFIVIGNDHRGHGKTGEMGMRGYFTEENGFQRVVTDLYEIMLYGKKTFPNLPYYFLGHSMGSFLMRNFIQYYSDEIDGLILTGTGHYSRALAKIGKSTASFLPPMKPSPIMNTLVLGSSMKRDTQYKHEWLTRDEASAAAYEDDPNTGFIPTARFFYDLLEGIYQTRNQRLNKNIRKDLPLLLLSGDQDMIGQYGKGVWKTADLFQKIGLTNILVQIYEAGKHELLHDICREEVFVFIGNWLKTLGDANN